MAMFPEVFWPFFLLPLALLNQDIAFVEVMMRVTEALDLTTQGLIFSPFVDVFRERSLQVLRGVYQYFKTNKASHARPYTRLWWTIAKERFS